MVVGHDMTPLVDALANHGHVVVPAWLPVDAVQALRADAEGLWQAGRFRHAGVGRGADFQVRPEIRSDRVLWLDDAVVTPALDAYLGTMERLREAFNRALYLGLVEFGAHLAVYPPGARYRPHLDHFRNTRHRVISSILYLNPPEWCTEDGGQLRVYLGRDPQGEALEVLPAGGTLVLFLAQRFWHEVLPAGRERWSITGWFCRRP